MRKLIVTAIVLSGIWIAVSPAAGALPSVDSAADQYVEYIPGVTGRGDGGSDSGAKDPGSASLPKKVIKKLEQRGDDGAAAAILAQSSAPPDLQSKAGPGSPKNRDHAPGDSSAKTTVEIPGLNGQRAETSGFSAVVSNIGGTGMGIALPMLLLLALVGVISTRVIEARASGRKSQD